MTIEEALKWADVFGPIQDDPPGGDGPALMALAAEVRRLRRGEFICQRCYLRKDGEHDGEPGF